jgi:hypothetical protein
LQLFGNVYADTLGLTRVWGLWLFTHELLL